MIIMVILKHYYTTAGCFSLEHREIYTLNEMLDEIKTMPNKRKLKELINSRKYFYIDDNGARYHFLFDQ